MEEEKKDNKGLKVGIIIFLTICLIGIFYFMFKMTYVGDKKKEDNTPKDTTEQTQVEFTELTKYELQEGEEKEITIGEKKLIIKNTEENTTFKTYLNDKEIDHLNGFYVTNNLIIGYVIGQLGDKYTFYNLEGEKLEESSPRSNLRIEEKKLLFDENYSEMEEQYKKGKVNFGPCGFSNGQQEKKLKELSEDLKEYENDVLLNVYEVKYLNGTITLEVYKSKTIVKDLIENENYCGYVEK